MSTRPPPSASRFFTIDPSGYVDASADDYDEETLRAKFAAVGGEIEWISVSAASRFDACDRDETV